MKKKSLRWILLVTGILAVLGLTGMNVYSLYTLRHSSIEAQRQSNKLRVAEFADRVRYRFIKPFYGLGGLDINRLEKKFKQTHHFTHKATRIVSKAAKDSIFQNIYYLPAQSNTCRQGGALLQFNSQSGAFSSTDAYPRVLCDGLGIARTRMKAIINKYRYNNKVIFDSDHSMIIALVNQADNRVAGYLALPFNRKYLINKYLQPQLVKTFGTNAHSSLNVWLRNWTDGQVIASSNPALHFNADKVQFKQQFPDFFDNWRLYASFNKNPKTAASQHSLWINLIILSGAFIFLVGAMLFMFFTARREEALAQRQSDFLANVTHELKTPISVMQAAGENLADGRVENQKRLQSYGSHIYSAAVRLRNMIDHLLEVAKTDANESFVHRTPLAIGEKVRDYIEREKSYITENKGFTLETSIQEHLPEVMVDEHSLTTIMKNLISNAIKYSGEDKYLGIRLFQEESDIVLQVEDHGIGIEGKAKNHIFEKFYRAEDPLTAKTNGYGLGLSIVKNLINLNGGTISVQSSKGQGSTFTVRFPVMRKSTKDTNRSKAFSSVLKFAKSTK
ncbi:MAG TPA: HAMP domain-containing sensor histidine kinase [Balneolaceae bacterium]|nr:HAMP domain-containing sensor histidine kinase [Balneolaceae bacterium]